MLPSALHVTPRRAPIGVLRGFRVAASVAGSVALVVAVVALVGVGLAPRLGFYRPLTVLSGSMRPAFAPGDLVIVTPEAVRDVRAGQVITYAIPVGDHHVETHRVVRVLHGGEHPVVITKGDANAAADPWKAELSGTTVWRYRFRIPLLGHAIVALRDPLVHKLTVLLLPALLALYGLLRIWRRRPDETSTLDARTNP
jgi:signal peptidase